MKESPEPVSRVLFDLKFPTELQVCMCCPYITQGLTGKCLVQNRFDKLIVGQAPSFGVA